MPNDIQLAELYKAALDRLYMAGSLTAILENNSLFVRGTEDPRTVRVARMEMQGLADYSRSTGYVDGEVTLQWETHTLRYDRGRRFQVDSMDNLESLDLPLLHMVDVFMAEHVVPEIDALRFAAICDKGTISRGALADGAAAIKLWDEALETLDLAEVPRENRHAFLAVEVYHKLKRHKAARERLVPGQSSDANFETLDGVPISIVPARRFHSRVELKNDPEGGFAPAADAAPINMMILHLPAVSAVTKHALPRIFGPEVNQSADATAFDYRVYHDVFVPANKTSGIFTFLGE